jgi:hypothetical protein
MLIAVSQAYAADYYVDNLRGNDASNGAVTQPWRSLSKSAERLVAQDTLTLVDNGPSAPYREKISPKASGVNGQVITISGAGPDARPFVIGSLNWSDRSAGGSMDWATTDNEVFTLAGVPSPSAVWAANTLWWKFAGVKSLAQRHNAESEIIMPGTWHYSSVDQTLTYRLQAGEAIENLHIEGVVKKNLVNVSTRHYITIEDIQFMFSAATAVNIIKASTNISLNNINVKHAGKNAIVASGGENISIENCIIEDVQNNGIYFGGTAEDKLRNSVIRGCTISRVRNNDCITLHKNSSLDDIGSGHLIENNLLSQSAEQGIDATSGSDITLLSNTTYGNGDSGIVLGHGVTNIVVANHLSVDDGRYAGILVNDAQDVSIANSCILDSIKHQVAFKDAERVKFEGNIVYQGQARQGSLIDITLNSSSIDFASNQIVSESTSDTLLLRYLQDNNPVDTNVYFYANSWSTPVENAESFYTPNRGSSDLQDHNQHYGRNLSDAVGTDVKFASLEQAINTNKCNLDLIPEKHKRWDSNASLLADSDAVSPRIETVSRPSRPESRPRRVVSSSGEVIELPPGC